MVDPTVRLAVAGDIAQLATLEAEARAALVEQRGGVRWLETHGAHRNEDWESEIEAGRVWVAHIGDAVVGFLCTGRHGDVATIDQVYVTPEARLLGFGDALVEAAVEVARQQGCVAIEGEALPGDRDTKNLYERAGITARLIVVAKRL